MKDRLKTGFADRAATSLEAKKAMLARFKPKPSVTAPEGIVDREAERLAEIERVRKERLEAKEAKRLAAIQAAEDAARALMNDEQARLESIRSARKDRQAREKEAARQRRESRLAMYGNATGKTREHAEEY